MVVVGAYLATAVGAFFAFSRSARSLGGELVERYVEAQSVLERNRILSIVDRELVLSRKLADDPEIRKWMLREENAEARAAAVRQLASYQRFLGYGTVFLAFRSSGHYYVATEGNPEFERTLLTEENPASRWFFDFLERNEDYALNVDYNVVLEEVRVWINVMVRDEDGRPIGLAGSGIDLTEFLDRLVHDKEPGISSIIVDSNGELQAHEDRSLIEHNGRAVGVEEKVTIFDLISDGGGRSRLKRAIEAGGEAPRLFPLVIDGKAAVAALATIPVLDWHNLVIVEADSVIGLSDFLPLGLVFLLSLLGVLAALFFMLSRLILTPLAALTRAAGAVAEGAYDTAVPPAGTAEIGKLSASFRTMTERVRAHTAELEEKVAERTRVLAETNEELVESQERVMDSIRYARLIQRSILPSEADLASRLAEHFVIFEPVDLVGGDFYFFRELEEGFCVAAVDCTGHGVPGALMTMMVNALLNRVMELHADKTPGGMLRELHELVQATLRSGAYGLSGVENGLDIALCRVFPEKGVVEFAGAGLPLLVGEEKGVRILAGDRRHLGFASAKAGQPFADHRVEVRPETCFYLITDGVLDLPGATNGFGLGRDRLLRILGTRNRAALSEREMWIRSALDDYQGDRDRKDDLLLFGFRVRGTKGA